MFSPGSSPPRSAFSPLAMAGSGRVGKKPSSVGFLGFLGFLGVFGFFYIFAQKREILGFSVSRILKVHPDFKL